MNTRLPGLSALLLWGFVALFFSGCAMVDQKINLAYSPTDRSFGRHNGEIAVSRGDTASPARNSKGEWIVGSINNVHGVHGADILSDRSVGEWITDALLLELKHAGYTVTYTATLPPGVPAGIVITDINAYLNINKGTVSDDVKHELKFNVNAYLNGARVKTFTVASRDSKTLLSASKEEQERIMLQSLQDAMLQIIPEIVALTGQK
jgi:hypothetical protein